MRKVFQLLLALSMLLYLLAAFLDTMGVYELGYGPK